MKKLWITLLMALCAAFGLLGFSACDPGETPAGGEPNGQTSDTGNTDTTDDNTDENGDNADDNTDDNTGGTDDEQVDPPVPTVKTYTVTVNCGEGGECKLSEVSPVEENTSLTITVVEHVGYELASFKIDGVETELTEFTYTFTVTKDVVVDVTFTSIPVVYRTVKVTAGDGGSCTLSDEGEVAEKTVVTLTVTPDEGYEVDKFYVNGKSAELTDGTTYTFTVTGNVTLKVSFKKHVHAYPAWEITEPTEKTEGLATRTCPNCTDAMQGHTASHVLPALSDKRYKIQTHSVESCSSEGSYTYSITVDGVTFTWNKTVEKLPHTYIYEITEPTKDIAGSATGVCQTCDGETEGHTIAIDLPVLSDSGYALSKETTCFEAGAATYSYTKDGYTVSFEGTAEARKHTFVKDSTGTVCTVCGKRLNLIREECLGTWYSRDDSDVLFLDCDVATLNGNPVTIKAGNKIAYDGITYTLSTQSVELVGKTATTLILNGKIDSSNLPVQDILYASDYPIRFPEAIQGTWSASDLAGTMGFTMTFDMKGIVVNSEEGTLLQYTERDGNISLTFSIGTPPEYGIDAENGYAKYSVEYYASTGKMTVTNELVDASLSNRTVECTKTGASAKGKLKLPQYAGTYVSAKGTALFIDAEGNVIYKDSAVSLTELNLKEGTGGDEGSESQYTIYDFNLRGVGYTLDFNTLDRGYVTITCAARGIENEVYTLQTAE